jgi:hypothetical protein
LTILPYFPLYLCNFYLVKNAFLNYFTKKIGYKEFSDAILYDIIDALATDNLEECITLLRKIFHLGKPLFLWEWNFGITI